MASRKKPKPKTGSANTGMLGPAPKGQNNLTNPYGLYKEAQNAAMVNEVGPFGSSSYSKGADGRWTRQTSLDPAQQSLVNAQNASDERLYGGMSGIQDRLAQMLSKDFNFDGAPSAPEYAGLGSAARQKYEDAVYGQQKKRLDDRFNQERNDFIQNLYDRGIQSDSDRGKEELKNFDQRRNDAYGDASVSSMREAGAESDRGFEQGMQARNQYIGEKTALRDRPFAELQGMMGSIRGPIIPQFGETARVDPTGIGTAFSQMGFQQQENAKDRATTLQAARMGGGGGGGGGAAPRDPIADYQAKQQIDYDMWLKQQQYANANKPKQKSNLVPSLVGSIGAGIGQGIGIGAGKGLF